MKYFKIFFFIGFIAFSTLSVQAQKLAYMNSASLFSSLSTFKAAEKELATYVEQLNAKFKEQEDALMAQVKTYQDSIKLLPPIKQKEREDQLKTQKNAIDLGKIQANQDVTNKEQALLKPIQDSVDKAVLDLLNEGNYAFIFDTAQPGILPGPAAEDVTEILRKMIEGEE
ncbi:MAG: OmpH family outer membrane protein [Chitinophagales bacterium]